MKKIVLCVLLGLIAVSLIGCAENAGGKFPNSANEAVETSSLGSPNHLSNNTSEEKMSKCKIIINGKDVTDKINMTINHELKYAKIPFFAVLRELGADIIWEEDTTAKIAVQNKTFIIDTVKGSLVESGHQFNFLLVAPGSKHGVVYDFDGTEFFIDSDSVKLFFIQVFGKNIIIDYVENTVTID